MPVTCKLSKTDHMFTSTFLLVFKSSINSPELSHIFCYILYIKINVSLSLSVCVCVCVCVCYIGAHTVHLIAMKLSQVIVTCSRLFWKFKNRTRSSTQCCSTGANTIHTIAMKLSQIVLNMLVGGFGSVKVLKIVPARVPSCCPMGVQIVHPIAMKLA